MANLNAQDSRVNNFSLKNLLTYQYRTSVITIQKLAFKDDLQYAYNVTFTSMGLTVSGRLSIPASVKIENIKGIVIMLRGYQRPSAYYTGKGTENPAKGYLEHGWAIIAPDFFGYANSSPTPPPAFLHQFYSTINTVELYKSLELASAPQIGPRFQVFQYSSAVPMTDRITLPGSFNKIVLWGHSNGGQVSFHFLEVIQKPVTAVIWAPTALSFPDSAGHFGQGAAWVETFRELYHADDFMLINFLDRIAGGTRIRLNQGDNDNSTPKAWSDALSKAIEEENIRRDASGRERIHLYYEVYRGADHNLNPYRAAILPRDVLFWEEN